MKRLLYIAVMSSAFIVGGCSSSDESSGSSGGLGAGSGGGDTVDAASLPGTDGADAATGTWGASEDAGSGWNGTDGTDGADGWSGWDGADMTEGTDMTDGADGWDGADGSSGSDGWSGVDGADGVDATDASDGSGGTDGTNGSSGGATGTDPGQCEPSCNGKQCGPDGCGGSCGWCSGTDSCQAGVCVDAEGCIPDCAGQPIGVDDGCGGVCSGGGFGIGLVPGGSQDAAYFRTLVEAGEVPNPELLPIEGWLTEHGTSLPAPETDRLVTLHGFVGLFYDPIEGEPTVALQLGMNSALPPEQVEAGHFNLSVVIDRSGSMAANDKLEFVKLGLIQMLDILDENDTLSIVTYSTTAKTVREPAPVTDKEEIIALIENINPAGSTNLHAGLQLGYQHVMKKIADSSLTPRVILLSDGNITAGVMNDASVVAMSGSYNEAGIGITTIGVGNDFNFSLMQALSVQGQGNFYFIESAEKLIEVFTAEVEYWLTPVADNLKVWFSLPDGFSVDEVYGFEWEEHDGAFHLLGPSPQVVIGEGGLVDPPPPTGEEPDVSLGTLFAAKKNGLLMVKLNSPGASAVQALENATLTTVHYSYDLIDEGTTEAWDRDIDVGSMEYDTENTAAFGYFSGATMQRNFCLLRSALAMKEACGLIAQDEVGNIQPAIQQLAWAETFCTGINVQLNDPDLVEAVTLMMTLRDNICGDFCAE